ncbi:MAG: hypothetical protein E8D41_02320 [Nitrospira sp.]|nr:MAG: hypothetical protein E8D41_02320 [Nitrospira sp.]
MAKIIFQIKPTVESTSEFASIFLGVASVWDGSIYPTGKEVLTNTLCIDAPGCFARTPWDKSENPILVRGGSSSQGVLHPFTFSFPDSVKILKLRWDFYQIEHDEGVTCQKFAGKPYLNDGIPYVHAVKNDGAEYEHHPSCYNDSETDWVIAAPHIAPTGGDQSTRAPTKP